MKRNDPVRQGGLFRSRRWFWGWIAVLGASSAPTWGQDFISGGALRVKGSGQDCPLKRTDVTVDVAGFVARVTVRQTFHNPSDTKIEAVYVFPLPQDAAVDDMVMTVGDRSIVGQIRSREEARQMYESAKEAGHVAGLLDQERPNVFTQSVANVEPGVDVLVELSYVQTLKYEDGIFEFVFPMVVGPRYVPGRPIGSTGAGTTPDTDAVSDASKIVPPLAPPHERAGHDIDITVNLDAGMKLYDLASELHDVDVQFHGPSRATVTLKNKDEVPNRDFILKYSLTQDEIGAAVLTREDERGAFFTLILQPPRRVVPERLAPRELIFVLDTSASMNGFPIETAKALMSRLIDTMFERDTFNLITFSDRVHVLWEAPRPDTPDNRREAQEFLRSRRTEGGTEMLKAVNKVMTGSVKSVSSLTNELIKLQEAGNEVFIGETESQVVQGYFRRNLPPGARSANGGDGPWLVSNDGVEAVRLTIDEQAAEELKEGQLVRVVGSAGLTDLGWRVRAESIEPAPLRVVCFMTDGYVGYDMTVIDAFRRHAETARVFSFGIGNSVNRFLLDHIARLTRGEVEYVTLGSQVDAAMERFHDRVLAPVLTDIEIDRSRAPVTDVYPKRYPDLFGAKPLMVHGRLTGPPEGEIVVRGRTGAGFYENVIDLSAPEKQGTHEALPSLWARAKIDDLMEKNYKAVYMETYSEELHEQITALGVEYRLVTPFTCFVAVEDRFITMEGLPRKVMVPVETPEGVSYKIDKAHDYASLISFWKKNDVMPLAKSGSAMPSAAIDDNGNLLEDTLRRMEALGSLGYIDDDGDEREPIAREASPRAARESLSSESFTSLKSDASRVRSQGYVSDARDATGSASKSQKGGAGKWKAKLDQPLRALVEKLDPSESSGDMTVGPVRMENYKVSVMIILANLQPETLKVLKEQGFEKADDDSRATFNAVRGAIDARRLKALARLDTVKLIISAHDPKDEPGAPTKED